MFCHHCHAEIEEGFQFCPKCGSHLQTVGRFFSGPEGRRSIRWAAAVAVILFGSGLIVFALRQNQISNLKPGKRDALAYAAWLASEQPSVSTLEVAIGKPIRSIRVSNGRVISWFRMRDGFLGMESVRGIFHFRTDKPLSRDDLSKYRQQSDAVLVGGEWLTTYDGPDLGLTTLASEKRPSEVTELIVWKQSVN
jgi:hypothetical protein